MSILFFCPCLFSFVAGTNNITLLSCITLTFSSFFNCQFSMIILEDDDFHSRIIFPSFFIVPRLRERARKKKEEEEKRMEREREKVSC